LPGSKSLGIHGDVLGISAQGELAMLLDPQSYESGNPSGTLARMRLESGAPRALLEHVFEADWSPRGDRLAAVTKTDTRYRLEYPIGTIRYEGEAWISDIRISPRDDRVAFLFHPNPKDDMGSVAILEGPGPMRELSSGWSSVRGLAWSPSGREIWFTGAHRGAARDLYAVDEGGHLRTLDSIAGGMLLRDVSTEGQALVDHAINRTALYFGSGEGERDLTWSDGSYLTGFSPDGRTVLYAGEDASEGPDYGAYMQTTDGAPPVRLGNGTPIALSPDGLWAAIRLFGPPTTLSLVPTGPGSAHELPLGTLATIFEGRFLPDGRSLLLRGIESRGHFPRLWVHELGDAPPRPITAEGMAPVPAISPRGDRIAGVGTDGVLHLFGIHGEDLGDVPGRFPDHIAVGFNEDGSALYVRTRSVPVRISRIALPSGAVTPHLTLPPGGIRPGLSSIMTLFLSADGRSHAYCANETFSRLYIVEGLK